MSILSEESWDRLIKEVGLIQDINNKIEAEEEKNTRKRNRPIEFKYNDNFYIKLLNYLEDKNYLGAGFHYDLDYDYVGDSTGNYTWWIEDRELGGTFTTLKELVEDVFSKFLDVPARDY